MKTYVRLRLNRVDVVDKGANPGAHITLAKRAITEERLMADTKDILPEAVAKRLADLEADNKALSVSVAKAEAEAKEQAETVAKMVETAAKAEAVTVAKGFDKLPGKTDEIAHLLFVAKRKFDASDYEAFVTVLKAADAQIKAGKLFSVTGVDADGDTASKVDQMIAKRMTEKNETRPQALRAIQDTPEGRAAWAELRGGN